MTRIYLNIYYKYLAVLALIFLSADTDYYRSIRPIAEFKGFAKIFDWAGVTDQTYVVAYLACTLPVFF